MDTFFQQTIVNKSYLPRTYLDNLEGVNRLRHPAPLPPHLPHPPFDKLIYEWAFGNVMSILQSESLFLRTPFLLSPDNWMT